MERVAIYARVSTNAQEERQTIKDQLDACRAYCGRQGYEVVEEFKDDGISGAVAFDERPEGKRLLELAQEGLFTRVVIYTVDRLGRAVDEGIIAEPAVSCVFLSEAKNPRAGDRPFASLRVTQSGEG
jgi:site-specific DNA recombinase